MTKKIIRISQVMAKTGLGRSTIYHLLKSDKKFPRSISLGSRSVGWIEAEVDKWIDSKINKDLDSDLND